MDSVPSVRFSRIPALEKRVSLSTARSRQRHPGAAPITDTARRRDTYSAEQIQILFPHWEIVRLMASVIPWPYPSDGALVYIRDIALPAVARGEQWHWTLRLKTAPDQLI